MQKYNHPILEYPFRSPLKVAETLKYIIKDKDVYDMEVAVAI